MLQTIREFALERLHERDESEAVSRRHAALCVALAEQAEDGLRRREQAVLKQLGRVLRAH
jgi:predicted ATPase